MTEIFTREQQADANVANDLAFFFDETGTTMLMLLT